MEEETMNQFVCSFQGCFRKFNTLESLKFHIERRHSQVTKTELPKIIQTRKVKKISLPIYSRKGQFGLKPPGLKELAANFQNSSQLTTIKEKMMKKYEGVNFLQKSEKMSTVKLEPLLKRENSMPKIKRHIDRSSQDDPESTIMSQKEEEKHSSQSVRQSNQLIQTTVSSGFDEIAFKTTQNFPKVEIEKQQLQEYNNNNNNSNCEKFSQLFELSNDLYTDENLPKIDIRPCSRPTTQQIIYSKQKLTKQFILQNAPGFNEIEDITQLILRGKERTAQNISDDDWLYVFEESNDFNPAMLVSLEFISLSHNQIKNLAGVGKCESLLELNINFNNVTELGPLRNCLNLRKL